MIGQKLRLKGVPPELVTRELEKVSGELSELEAARIWARKKRLGPFRQNPDERSARRERDLAALARAGFSFGTAKAVIDGQRE
jgi:regulatory protein